MSDDTSKAKPEAEEFDGKNLTPDYIYNRTGRYQLHDQTTGEYFVISPEEIIKVLRRHKFMATKKRTYRHLTLKK